jgi:cytochrome c553
MMMKLSGFLTAGIAAVAIAACTNLERSRSLNDPVVPAQATARQVCSNCHGVDGNSVSPNFPNLAGQTEPYLIEQLTGFRRHSRSDPAGFEYMWGLSRHLTDDQIKGLASYFASQKPLKHRAAPGGGQAAAGQKIFEDGIPEKNVPPCRSCHGDRAQGNGQFPRLADQHADYVVKQLGVFQRTDQRPDGAMMKSVAHDLTESNMKDVAAFLQAMPAQ